MVLLETYKASREEEPPTSLVLTKLGVLVGALVPEATGEPVVPLVGALVTALPPVGAEVRSPKISP